MAPAKKGKQERPSDLQLLDGLIPGLYALATGRPLIGPDGQPYAEQPKMDVAMVDRVIKVLELKAKLTQAGKEPTARKGPSWGEVAPLGGRE